MSSLGETEQAVCKGLVRGRQAAVFRDACNPDCGVGMWTGPSPGNWGVPSQCREAALPSAVHVSTSGCWRVVTEGLCNAGWCSGWRCRRPSPALSLSPVHQLGTGGKQCKSAILISAGITLTS